jgi:hypothetical protein
LDTITEASGNASIEKFFQEGLQQTVIDVRGDTLVINGKYKSKFTIKKEGTYDYFGNMRMSSTQFIEDFKRKGIDISDSISYLKLSYGVVNGHECAFFDTFELVGSVIYVDNYICLPFRVPDMGRALFWFKRTLADVTFLDTISFIKESRFKLPFKGRLKGEEGHCDSIRTIDLLQPNKVSLNFGGRFGVTRYIAMPRKGNFKVIACQDEEGPYPYYYRLYTVKGNQVVDGLYVEGEWWTEGEEEHNVFSISEDYTIAVSILPSTPEDTAKIKRYRIDEDGYFYDTVRKGVKVNQALAARYLENDSTNLYRISRLPFSLDQYVEDHSCGMDMSRYPAYQPTETLERYLKDQGYDEPMKECRIIPSQDEHQIILLVHLYDDLYSDKLRVYYLIITADKEGIISNYVCFGILNSKGTFTIGEDLLVTRHIEYSGNRRSTERVRILDDGTIEMVQKESEDKERREYLMPHCFQTLPLLTSSMRRPNHFMGHWE